MRRQIYSQYCALSHFSSSKKSQYTVVGDQLSTHNANDSSTVVHFYYYHLLYLYRMVTNCQLFIKLMID